MDYKQVREGFRAVLLSHLGNSPEEVLDGLESVLEKEETRLQSDVKEPINSVAVEIDDPASFIQPLYMYLCQRGNVQIVPISDVQKIKVMEPNSIQYSNNYEILLNGKPIGTLGIKTDPLTLRYYGLVPGAVGGRNAWRFPDPNTEPIRLIYGWLGSKIGRSDGWTTIPFETPGVERYIK